jgi:hypothetical protein
MTFEQVGYPHSLLILGWNLAFDQKYMFSHSSGN